MAEYGDQKKARPWAPWARMKAPVGELTLESGCHDRPAAGGGTPARRMLLVMSLAGGLIAPAIGWRGGVALAAQRDAPAAHASSGAGPRALRMLRQWSAATSWLYRSVAPSLVQVKLGHNPDTMLPGAQRKEFRAWRKHWLVRRHFLLKNFERGAAHGAPTIVIRPGEPKRRHFRPHGKKYHITHHVPPWLNSPRGRLMLLRRFLVYRFRKTHQPQPLLWKMVNQRLTVLQQSGAMRVLGLAVGPKRRVLVLMILQVPGTRGKVTVILPGGKKVRAAVLGTDMMRGITVLKLPASAPVRPLRLAHRLPREGQLLMCLGSGHGTVSWITAVTPNRRFHHHLKSTVIALPFRKGRRSFVFNLRGHLTALGLRPLASPVRLMRKYLKHFIQSGAVERNKFGVHYALLGAHSKLRKRYPALRGRPALLIQKVVLHSPAQFAGFRENDLILRIDHRSVLQLPAIRRALLTRTGSVPVDILRRGRPLTLYVPLHGPGSRGRRAVRRRPQGPAHGARGGAMRRTIPFAKPR